MTDPQIDDLKSRIHQLETSNRRWKRLTVTTWIVLGLLVLSLTAFSVMMMQKAMRRADELMWITEQFHQAAQQAQEAVNKAEEAAKAEQAAKEAAILEMEKALKARKDALEKR